MQIIKHNKTTVITQNLKLICSCTFFEHFEAPCRHVIYLLLQMNDINGLINRVSINPMWYINSYSDCMMTRPLIINSAPVTLSVVTKFGVLESNDKFNKIKNLTDRFISVVTQAGIEEFNKHYDYMEYLLKSIQQNKFDKIYDNIQQPPDNLNNDISFMQKQFTIPIVTKRKGRPKGRKPLGGVLAKL
jgi:hypothetical protein